MANDTLVTEAQLARAAASAFGRLGGKATAGLMTDKKRESCLKNLERARKIQKANRRKNSKSL